MPTLGWGLMEPGGGSDRQWILGEGQPAISG